MTCKLCHHSSLDDMITLQKNSVLTSINKNKGLLNRKWQHSLNRLHVTTNKTRVLDQTLFFPFLQKLKNIWQTLHAIQISLKWQSDRYENILQNELAFVHKPLLNLESFRIFCLILLSQSQLRRSLLELDILILCLLTLGQVHSGSFNSFWFICTFKTWWQRLFNSLCLTFNHLAMLGGFILRTW